MADYSQVQLNDFDTILTKRPANPQVGMIVFNSIEQNMEVFDGTNWQIIPNNLDFDNLSLLDNVIKLIKESEPAELQTLLCEFDKLKNVLEKEYLTKC